MEDGVPGWQLDIQDSTGAMHQREEFVRYLEKCGAVGDYAAAEIIFGEIVGNAMLHAPGPIAVSVKWSAGSAILRVSDRGRPFDTTDVRTFPEPYGEYGRGLPLAGELSPCGIITEMHADGKTVSAELPVRLG